MKTDGKKTKYTSDSASGQGFATGRSIQWYNPQPNSDDVKWLESNTDLFAKQVADLVVELQVNQRLSVRLDVKSGRWLAILFDDPTTPDGAVHALSCRASSGFNALVLLHYFHRVKFVDGWRQEDFASGSDFG